MVNILKKNLIEEIRRLSIDEYVPLREISRILGVSKTTVSRYRRQIGGAEVLCGCGKNLNHRGFCHIRYSRSPARKKWLQFRWHKRVEARAKQNEPDETYYGIDNQSQ